MENRVALDILNGCYGYLYIHRSVLAPARVMASETLRSHLVSAHHWDSVLTLRMEATSLKTWATFMRALLCLILQY